MNAVARELKAASAVIGDQEEQAFKTYLLAAARGFETNEWGPADEAWAAIDRYLFAFVSGGGDFFGGRWMKDAKTMIACCNDGIRPVVFKLERIDD